MRAGFQVSISVLGLGLAVLVGCGPKNAMEASRNAETQTEVCVEGGVSPFQARLSLMSPEAMAIQEVPYGSDPKIAGQLEAVVARYRRQWTFRLTIGPKPGAKSNPERPFALDIENNGGMWGDHSRNLNRLMFEMGPLIRLVLPDGKEVEPSIVEFQRAFGMGLDRSWLLVFPVEREGKALSPPLHVRVKEFGQGTGTLDFEVRKAPPRYAAGRLKSLWKQSWER